MHIGFIEAKGVCLYQQMAFVISALEKGVNYVKYKCMIMYVR